MKFIQKEMSAKIIKKLEEEQYYTAHYENGVETIKKNTLHV